MKKIVTFLVFCMAAVISSPEGLAGPYGPPKPKANEVAIHFSGIEVPLNRILLIRKDAHYCAVKFTRCWTEIDEKIMKKYASNIAQGDKYADYYKEISEKKYAIYEVYYQGDGTANFANKNVKVSQGKASLLPLRGFHPFEYQSGDAYIRFGPFRLTWNYKTFVGFMPAGKGRRDFGFELAPTPWIKIAEVNILDPRLKWYRYDARRKRVFIPIYNLWEEIHKERSNEVLIATGGIEVPLGRILLVREASQYCAIRFKKYWTENDGKEIHASYETYCPEEGSSDFSSSRIKVAENHIFLLSPQKLSSPIKRPENEQVKCGTIKLHWEGNGFVSFHYDYHDRHRSEVELAPTPWLDISQINIYDQRVMWYKTSFTRRNMYVPIDKLW